MSNYRSIRLYPIFKRAMAYNEHFAGNLQSPGDALGRDCQVTAFDIGASQTAGMMKLHTGDGTKNEDWFTYNVEVYAPLKGVVTSIYLNEHENTPGGFEPSRASSITITQDDGVNVILAHVKDIIVKVGDEVEEGQHIAHGGNNGCSRSPHVHVGAWQDDECIQVEFDLYKMGDIVQEVGEGFYVTGYTDEQLQELMG